MRLRLPLLLGFLPAAAFENCAADQRGFQSDAVGSFVTNPCDAACTGLDAESFGR